MRLKSLPIQILVCLLWLVGTAVGFSVLSNYQATQGAVGNLPAPWPATARVALDPSRDTLLMFVHPQCPCTRASVEELNRLMGQADGKVAARVYFFRPRTQPANWVKTGLWRAAAAIPGVAVQEDLDGETAGLFGAETSGYVLLYDIHKQLLFHGGITESRGHIGDNAGENAIVSLLRGQASVLEQTPVFGCSLTSCAPGQPSEK